MHTLTLIRSVSFNSLTICFKLGSKNIQESFLWLTIYFLKILTNILKIKKYRFSFHIFRSCILIF